MAATVSEPATSWDLFSTVMITPRKFGLTKHELNSLALRPTTLSLIPIFPWSGHPPAAPSGML